jgi:2-(1,2-epoxy-1,2-dihydrophenyl)acetyl-CoA isomerase
MSEPVTLAVEDGLARLTLNRPEAYNTLNLALADGLMKAAMRCAHGRDVRAVLLTAAGSNFCGGGDLKSFHAQGDGIDGHVREVTYLLHAACAAFARMDAPLVVACQGAVAGAGMSIALLGDLVYAGESAFFTMAYTAAGLSPDGGSTFLLPRVVGLRRAQELTLTNRRLTAAEAVDWGIATAVVHDADLQLHAAEIAHKLARGPSRAFGRAKRLLIDSFDTSFEAQMDREGRYIAASAAEPDGRAGVDAFVNKRKPAFTGRV